MNDYFLRLQTAILFSKQYNNLLGKSELGTDMAESANVELAKSLSQTMATNLGYDGGKTEVLALCKGIVFPPYGKAGMEYIKSKMEQENITLSYEEICMRYLEEILQNSSLEITEELRDGVKEVFSNNPAEGEAKVVKVTYDILQDIETLKRSDEDMADKLEDKTIDIFYDAISESKASGQISCSRKLRDMMSVIKVGEQEELKEEEKAVIDNLWNEYKSKGMSNEDIAINVIYEIEK